MDHCYDNFINELANRTSSRLNQIEAKHGFDYGDEFEIALCETLREFLPEKYGICRGFVVNFDGDKAGDDIIIYDQERFPTLKLKGKGQFSRKENIPIEAVYAYIEAKHNLIVNNTEDRSSLIKALEQVKKVKALINQRKKANLNNSALDKERGFPKYSNPPFTILWARRVSIKNSKDITSDPYIIDDNLWRPHINHFDPNLYPDFIVLGGSNFYSTSYVYKNNNEFPVFNLFEQYDILRYARYIAKDLASGMALAFLMTAIDQMELGRMPWASIVNNFIHKEIFKL